MKVVPKKICPASFKISSFRELKMRRINFIRNVRQFTDPLHWSRLHGIKNVYKEF